LGLFGVLFGVEGALFLDLGIVDEAEGNAKRNRGVDEADQLRSARDQER